MSNSWWPNILEARLIERLFAIPALMYGFLLSVSSKVPSAESLTGLDVEAASVNSLADTVVTVFVADRVV